MLRKGIIAAGCASAGIGPPCLPFAAAAFLMGESGPAGIYQIPLHVTYCTIIPQIAATGNYPFL